MESKRKSVFDDVLFCLLRCPWVSPTARNIEPLTRFYTGPRPQTGLNHLQSPIYLPPIIELVSMGWNCISRQPIEFGRLSLNLSGGRNPIVRRLRFIIRCRSDFVIRRGRHFIPRARGLRHGFCIRSRFLGIYSPIPNA